MARNGSGGYSLPANSWNPAVNGASATYTDWNSTAADITAAIAQSVSSDGQTTMTGNLPMGGNKLLGLSAGSAAAPSISPTGDTNTGVYFPAADSVAIAIGGSDGIKLASSGLVTLGVSPGAGQTNLLINGPSSDNNWGGRVDLYSNNGSTVRTTLVGTSDGFKVYNDGFSTEDLALNASKTLTLRGATASSGTGIAFPSTQAASSNANTLDDYEEGSWTPVLGGDGGTSGQAYTTQYGRYVKVGQLVTCWYHIELSTKGTITGNASVTGLPFTVNSAFTPIQGFIGRFVNMATSWTYLFAGPVPNQSYAWLGGTKGVATTWTAAATADIANNSRIEGSFSYIV